MTVDNLISLLGIISGLLAFWLGLKKYGTSLEQRKDSLQQKKEGLEQYEKSQSWKRLEFVARELRTFVDIAEVRNAIDMMSWSHKKIEFFPNSKISERNVYEMVSCKNITNAFTNLNQCRTLTPLETLISETFDIFFQEVERLNGFVKTKLISDEDLEPYIYFWVDLLNAPESYAAATFSEKNQPSYLNAIYCLKEYIGDDGYPGVTDLLKRIEDLRVSKQTK